MDELREEVRILESLGHKRLALEAGEKAIREHLMQIPGPAVRKETEARLDRIARGERDLYF